MCPALPWKPADSKHGERAAPSGNGKYLEQRSRQLQAYGGLLHIPRWRMGAVRNAENDGAEPPAYRNGV